MGGGLEVPLGLRLWKSWRAGERNTEHQAFEVWRGDSWLLDITSDWKDGSEQILDTMVMHL